MRNKGLGSAATTKMLLGTKNNGCVQALLFASEMGKSMYQKLGFEEYELYHFYGN